MNARTRRLLVSGAVLAVLAPWASPAAAGGWWSTPQLEHRTPALATGETTTVSSSVLFDSASAAENAADTGDFYAFLVRGIDETALEAAMAGPQPERWWIPPAEAIRLGPLTFGPNDANHGSVSARFVVPDVPPGVYDLMLCDAECSEPLADVVPLRSVYVGDPLAVRMLRESRSAADHLIVELDRAGDVLADVDAGLRGLEGQVEGLDARMDDTASTLDALTEPDLTGMDRQSAVSTPAGPRALEAGGGWFLAGAAMAFAWSRRRAVTGRDAGAPSRDADGDEADGSGSSDLPAPEFVTSG